MKLTKDSKLYGLVNEQTASQEFKNYENLWNISYESYIWNHLERLLKKSIKNELEKILKERNNRDEDIRWCIDSYFFGFGSLEKLKKAHNNNYSY